jgi:2-oxoglutarate dehydrogenase E1 component
MLLVRAFQVRGHYAADLDPLRITSSDPAFPTGATQGISLEDYGFSEKDHDRMFSLDIDGKSKSVLGKPGEMKLIDIFNGLKAAYCGSIGVDYMHLQDKDQIDWIANRFENVAGLAMTVDEKKLTLDRLMWAELFESFLKNKFATAKRFGLEGGEALIPGMKALIDHGSTLGIESCIIGMPHRGRLNVLGNVVRKPFEDILTEFAGTKKSAGDATSFLGSGDVKYHLGMSYNRPTRTGKMVHLSLVANPSHLEAVNPVVEGKTRAKQFYSNDVDRTKHVSILLHGDAAFSGQGVVFETMGLSDLHNYTTGGTIHMVVNNQIGFTTDPKFSRSSPYCSDVAKFIGAPIFHVNGDDPEAVVRCSEIAIAFRQKFHTDVVIDIVCYRRHGHNEVDLPDFTQPEMYRKIKNHPTPVKVYSDRLVAEGAVTPEFVANHAAGIIKGLEDAFTRSRSTEPQVLGQTKAWLDDQWSGFVSPDKTARVAFTGVEHAKLQYVGKALAAYPQGFNIHRKIGEIMKSKGAMMESGKGLDWAMGEALAYGTLLLEGYHVRLSGQDVERGTFSHRHAVLHDQQTEQVYIPLNNIDRSQAVFQACNSNLSEFAVLGFELGYSMENPKSMVIWEAQFGDFSNTAQCIIDQFLSSGEAKWMRQSGLVMLLPHGYDGQGPEHSSCRVERFLQMSDEDPDVFPDMEIEVRSQVQRHNWQVVNCTTPAQFFHVLRRQINRPFRKPLIVLSPKRLLRYKLCVSDIEDFGPETRFRRAIGETEAGMVADEKVRRVILCNGQVYFDLLNRRTEKGIKDVVICRIEQLAPFPFDYVNAWIKQYPNAEVVWAQEEPKNMGAWMFMQPRIETASRGTIRPKYVGRPVAASPATGFGWQHAKEIEDILTKAFAQ